MKLYVPNAQKWVDFFERVSSGKTSLNQVGGGRRSSVISVDDFKHVQDKTFPIKAVLPAEQTTAQARSELERQDIKPASVVNMIHSSRGRRPRRIKRKGTLKRIKKRTKRQRGGKIVKKRTTVRKGRKRRTVKTKRNIFPIN